MSDKPIGPQYTISTLYIAKLIYNVIKKLFEQHAGRRKAVAKVDAFKDEKYRQKSDAQPAAIRITNEIQAVLEDPSNVEEMFQEVQSCFRCI